MKRRRRRYNNRIHEGIKPNKQLKRNICVRVQKKNNRNEENQKKRKKIDIESKIKNTEYTYINN